MKIKIHPANKLSAAIAGCLQRSPRVVATTLYFSLAGLGAACAGEPFFAATWDGDIEAERSPGPSVPTTVGVVRTDDATKDRKFLNLEAADASLTFSDVVFDDPKGTVALWWRPAFDVAGNEIPKAILYWSNRDNPGKESLILRVESPRAPHNVLQFVVRGTEGDPDLIETSIAPLMAGEWYWIAATWTESEIVLYVDGARVAEKAISPSPMSLNQLVVGSVFGKQAAAGFDQLQIWPEAFNDEEIKALYKEHSNAILH